MEGPNYPTGQGIRPFIQQLDLENSPQWAFYYKTPFTFYQVGYNNGTYMTDIKMNLLEDEFFVRIGAHYIFRHKTSTGSLVETYKYNSTSTNLYSTQNSLALDIDGNLYVAIFGDQWQIIKFKPVDRLQNGHNDLINTPVSQLTINSLGENFVTNIQTLTINSEEYFLTGSFIYVSNVVTGVSFNASCVIQLISANLTTISSYTIAIQTFKNNYYPNNQELYDLGKSYRNLDALIVNNQVNVYGIADSYDNQDQMVFTWIKLDSDAKFDPNTAINLELNLQEMEGHFYCLDFTIKNQTTIAATLNTNTINYKNGIITINLQTKTGYYFIFSYEQLGIIRMGFHDMRTNYFVGSVQSLRNQPSYTKTGTNAYFQTYYQEHSSLPFNRTSINIDSSSLIALGQGQLFNPATLTYDISYNKIIETIIGAQIMPMNKIFVPFTTEYYFDFYRNEFYQKLYVKPVCFAQKNLTYMFYLNESHNPASVLFKFYEESDFELDIVEYLAVHPYLIGYKIVDFIAKYNENCLYSTTFPFTNTTQDIQKYGVQLCTDQSSQISISPLLVNFIDRCEEAGSLINMTTLEPQYTYFKGYPALSIPFPFATFGDYAFQGNNLLIQSNLSTFTYNQTFVFDVKVQLDTVATRTFLMPITINMHIENCAYSKITTQKFSNVKYKIFKGKAAKGQYIPLKVWNQDKLSCPPLLYKYYIDGITLTKSYENIIYYDEIGNFLAINTNDTKLSNMKFTITITGSNSYVKDQSQFMLSFIKMIQPDEPPVFNYTSDQVNKKEQLFIRTKKLEKNTFEAKISSISNKGKLIIVSEQAASLIEEVPELLVYFKQAFLIRFTQEQKDPVLIKYWNVDQVNENKIVFNIKFPNPSNVSFSNSYDTIEIVLNKSSPIYQPDDYDVYIPQKFILQAQVPPQLSSQSIDVLESATGTVSYTMTSSIAVNIVLCLFLGASLKSLWTLMNTLQIIVYLPMLKMSLPSNFSMMCQSLIDIVNFNFIPKDQIQSTLKGLFRITNDQIVNDPNLNAIDIF
eukprot:403357121